MTEPPPVTVAGLETILRLNSKLRNVTNPEAAFGTIADELKTITEADYALILLIEEGSATLKLAGISGTVESEVPRLPPILIDREYRERIMRRDFSSAIKFDSVDELPKTSQPIAKMLGVDSGMISPIMLRGEFVGYVAVGRRKGGPPFPPDADKTLAMISDYFAVVVDNVHSSMEVRKAKAETDRMLSFAPIAMFTCDSKGIFMSVNKQMLRVLDRDSEEDLVGTSIFEQPILIKSGLEALISQGMEGHEGEKVDVHIVQSPERAFYLHAKVMPIKSARDEVERVLFVAMDVSSKVRLENQLERSYEKLTQTYQELERVATMKTQFIDVVSHELRTPLTVMRGYIELVESEYSAKLEPKFASRLAVIKANTDKLYSLVESMLDVSRIEKGSLQMHPEPVRMDSLLEDVVKAKEKDAEDKKQVLSMEIEGQLPLIMADRRRLKDVFSNILDNAIKYTQETGRIQVGARDEGRVVHIWVKDNGVGIPLENIGKIFDRFHIVASDDLSHQVNRLGLGLPISKGIIDAHGGRLWVESQVGKGSVFHVDLPKESPK